MVSFSASGLTVLSLGGGGESGRDGEEGTCSPGNFAALGLTVEPLGGWGEGGRDV